MLRSLPILLLAVAFFVAPRAVRADIIGVGLDWRSGIFVQEFWEKGAPSYLIANHSKAAVELTVHDFDSSWRLNQPLPKAVAGPFKIPAGGRLVVDAKALVGGGLRRWMIVGKQPLGVLPSPIAPSFEGAGICTSLGLSGSGGSLQGLYAVHPKLEIEAGAMAKVVLHIPGNAGTLKFQVKPDVINDPLRPQNLIVEKAESDTLKITKDEKQIVIDATAPAKDGKSHQVVLTIAIPKVQTSSLYMFDGWLANSMGGGSGVTRGIWVIAK